MTSIFLPIPLIRNSERADFKTCQAKWNWRWNLGLVPAMPKQDARWFGSLWHLLWATVYTPPGKDGLVRGITKVEEIHQLWDELSKGAYTTVSCVSYFDDDDEKKFWDAISLGHIMIDGQYQQWKLDPGYEVLAPEQRFSLNVPFNKRQRELPLNHWTQLGYPRGASAGGYIAKGVGTFDLTIRDHTDGRGRVWVLDWKTTSSKTNLKQGNKDDQLGLYVAVGTVFLRKVGMLKADEQICGGIWSFAKKSKPPDPATVDEQGRVHNKPLKKHYEEQFDLWELPIPKGAKIADLEAIAREAGIKVWGEVSARQGGPLFWREPVVRNRANRIRTITRLADEAEVISAVRNGVSPVIKNPGEHCNWCDFNDLCDIDEDGGDTQTFIKDVYKFEDPYMDHQQGAINSKLNEGG